MLSVVLDRDFVAGTRLFHTRIKGLTSLVNKA